MSERPRLLLKAALTIANLAFLQKYIEFELPQPLADRLEMAGPPETIASVVSALLALANHRATLDSFDLGVPFIGDLQDNELRSGGPGGRLCAESLANVLVVHLIRQRANGPSTRELARKPDGRLPRHATPAVAEYIDAHLDQNFAVADLAAVAHLSEFHFARQFKQTTGLSPHQFVIH